MNAWVAFWIFLAVCVVVDAWLYNKGHDGVFFTHKTDEEKRIREAKIKLLEKQADYQRDTTK